MDRSVRVRLEASVDGFVSNVGVKAVGAVKKLGDAADKVSTKVEQVGARGSSGLNKVLESADTNSQHLDRLGGAATKVGVAVGAGLGLAAKAAIDWESAWAGVTKTVDGSASEMAELEGQLRGMAKTLPATHTEIAAVAEAAGQLGVRRQDIAAFTRVMVDLGETTNLTSDEAATSLAQLMNVMQTAPQDVGRLGAALVALGNDGASTEKDILEMAQRISGSGTIIGLSEQQVLGYASALANVGIEAEAGGSAISSVFTKIDKAVSEGSSTLDAFAQLAGLTSEQFRTQFETDAAGATQKFIEGLGRMNTAGGDVNSTLETLGITEIRQRDAVLRLAASGDNLNRSLDVSNQGWKDNTALVDEAAKRYATTESQVSVAWNQIKDAAIEAGTVILPVISDVAGAAADMAEAFGNLPDGVQQAVVGIGALVAIGGLAVGAVAKMVTTTAELKSSLEAVGISGDKASRGVSGLVKAGVVVGVAALATELQHLADATQKADLSGLTGDMLRFGETGKATGSIAKNFGDDFGGAARSLQADGKSLGEALKRVSDSQDSTVDSIERFLGGGSQWVDRVHEMDEALAQLVEGGNAESAAKAFTRLEETAKANGVGLEELNRIFPEYQAAVEAAGVDAEIAGDKAAGAGAGNKALAGGLESVADTAQEAEDALEAYISQLFLLPGMVLGLRDAQRGVQAAIDDATASLKENGRTLDIGTEKGRANQAALDAIAAAANALSESQLRANVAQATMTKGAVAAREEFVRVGVRMGLTRKAAEEYAAKLIAIPKKVATDVTNTADKAKTKATDYKTQGLDKLPKKIATSVAVENIHQSQKEVGDFATHVSRSLQGIKDEAIRVSLAYTQHLGQNPQNERMRRATGGPVFGAGTATSDSIPALLSNNEHVWTAAEVKAAGGHDVVEAMRKAVLQGYATGGSVGVRLPTVVPSAEAIAAVAAQIAQTFGQEIGRARGTGPLNFARSQAGKPYVWGGVGPGGYDCSGFMSAITNVILGRSPYSRLFATGGFPTSMFAPGMGTFSIGSFRGNPGHMAGTLAGVNVESRGGDGVVVGAGARGARDALFGGNIWHLKGYATGGGIVGDPPFDLLDPRGKKFKGTGALELLEALERGVLVRDRGGPLPTGTSLVRNSTGHEEWVTPHRLATGGEVIHRDRYAPAGFAGGAPGGSVTRVVERIIAAGQLTITNWQTGTGYFRVLARDEIDSADEFASTIDRMRGAGR